MIVRDSARTLPACLASIAPWVDEMIVVDTGSQDNTRGIALDYGGQVHEFPWCDDFSAARNESLRHASGEWLFWMDSDDTISEENGRRLRDLADLPLDAAPTAYVMQVHCPGPGGTIDVTVVDHVKLFRNDPRLRFEGRIHEQILPAIRRLGGEVRWTDVFVAHSGAEHTAEARRRKQERDLRLLEMEAADRPDHPFVLFNLGMTCADIGAHAKAVEHLRRCLDASSADESHVRKAYALLAGSLADLGRLAEAEQALDQGLRRFRDDPELWFRRGVLQYSAGDFSGAVSSFEQAIAPEKVARFSSRDRGITSFKARHNLALSCQAAGRPEMAEFHWRLALDEQPGYVDAWTALVNHLLDRGRYTTLELEAVAAERDKKIPREDVVATRARVVHARQGPAAAIDALDAAYDGAHEPTVLLRLRCQWLFELSQLDKALPTLEELCRRDPEDGASWHNLGTAHRQAGRLALAATSFQKSLTVRPKAVHTLLQLGHCHYELGRLNLARNMWEEANEQAPNDATVKATLSLLDKSNAAAV